MKATVGILDYGIGNVASVRQVFVRTGARVVGCSTTQSVMAVDALVLPGVGSFGVAMQRLSDTGLSAAIHERASSDGPILGICLGMQVLFQYSEEAPGVPGLGLIGGRVERLPGPPRIGWFSVVPRNPQHPQVVHSRFVPASPFFFSHNYYVQTDATDSCLGTSGANGEMCAVVGYGTILGVQFHPEKSQRAGLTLLQRLVNSWG